MSLTESVLFEQLDQSVQLLQEDAGFSYLEALIESGENLLANGDVLVKDGIPSPTVVKQLETIYKQIDLNAYTSEDVRKALQLLFIKGMRADYIQPNHQMTPDSIASFIAYLIEIIAQPATEKILSIADLTLGTGNLLFTIYHFLTSGKRQVTMTGIENDELLISLASMSSALQQLDMTLYHQDSLQNLLLEPVDIMVGDLPIGYYPVDQNAARFKTAREEGHSYVHHLMLEQGLHYLRPGGFGFYIVPSNLFDSVEGKQLLTYIQSVGHFQGFIQLPKDMFKTEAVRKSILIVQKQSESSTQASEVLLGTAPSFNDSTQMKEFLGEINIWKNDHII